SRGERILLVEDEPAMLEVTTEMLQDLGYRVVPAAGPRQAIELARTADHPFALLITDVVMPEMNGVDLARALRDGQPGLLCLFVSGYTPEVIAQRGLTDDASALLSKPFSGEALARKVRELLDA
ncbi:MAG: response regulator, partial [Vicinamibacteria bacterium]|nr:response regulator [Vicinamibacteria bacterium]